ncbi:zinc ribbon domain-containing protein [bacterium]
MDKFCQSCGMPLTDQPSDQFCQYCTDETGQLKSREAVREGIAAWLQMFTPNPENIDFQKRAEAYLNAMPAWAEV